MSQTRSELINRKSKPIAPGTPALESNEVSEMIGALPGWVIEGEAIEKTYAFKNYHETMAFVNAVAWIAHREDHHPDMEVSYNKCVVRYSTHAVGGLSENDFIGAAKVEGLVSEE